MAQFKWDSPTISVTQILEELAVQYGIDKIPVGIQVDDLDAQIGYVNAVLPIHCNRCGKDFMSTPKMLLSSKYSRGYACSSCGSKTGEQLRNEQLKDRLEEGSRFLKERGIDPEEEDRKAQQAKEDEAALAITPDDIMQMQEDLGKSNQRARSVESEVAQPSKPAMQTKSVESVAPIRAEQPADEEIDVSAYSYDEETDGNSSMAALLDPENNPEGDIVDDEPSEEEVIEDDVSDDADPESFEDTEEEEEADEIEFDENENEGEDEFDGEEIADDATEEEDDSSDKIIVGGVAYTQESLAAKAEETFDTLRNPNVLGYVPYTKHISADSTDNAIHVHCRICDNDFDIESFDDLIDGIVKIDENFCVNHGLQYKGSTKLHACPHCSRSVFSYGYNQYLRKSVEDTFARARLNIVNPEKYYYANLKDSYEVEANGIKRTYSYVKFINAHGEEDMSKHADFTPRSTETKSAAAPVATLQASPATKEYIAPKFEPQTQIHLNKIETVQPLDAEFKRQQEAARSEMVFRPGIKLTKSAEADRKNIARLNGEINPFEHEKSLESSFYSSCFASFIEDLKENSGVECKLIINASTFEIPVVDFETGVRIICADLAERSIANVPYDRIAQAAKFSYRDDNNRARKFKYVVLFSDSVTERKNAAIDALTKIINPSVLAYGGKRIELTGSLNVQYTDYAPFLRDFDDLYSTFPSGKPKTGQLGIVAQWASTRKAGTKEVMTIEAIMNGGASSTANLGSLESEYSQYMASSIRYIARQNKDTGRVVFVITEYVEIGSALIADGLLLCIRALLKEYSLKYPAYRNDPPHIIFELDPNTFASPSIKSYIEKGTLIPMDECYRTQVEGNANGYNLAFARRPIEQHFRYSYVRKPEYRTRDDDWMRHDMRMFHAGTLVKRMAQEIKEAGIQNAIVDNSVRLSFIANMGFVKATQLETKEFFVSQAIVRSIMMDGRTATFPKLPEPDSLFAKSGLVADGSSGGVNNVFANPMLIQRYMNVMKNSTPEAQAYLNSIAQQRQQQAYMAQYAQMQQNMQQSQSSQPGMSQSQPSMVAMPMGMMGMQQPMMGGMGMMGGMPGMNMMQQPMMGGMGMMGMQVPTAVPRATNLPF